MSILTGEEPEDYGKAPAKNQAAAELGRAGQEGRYEKVGGNIDFRLTA